MRHVAPRLERGPAAASRRGYPKMNAEVYARGGGEPRIFSPGRQLDVEALAAAALALDVRVAEAERLVEAFPDEIDLGAVHVEQALVVDDHLDAGGLEHGIASG